MAENEKGTTPDQQPPLSIIARAFMQKDAWSIFWNENVVTLSSSAIFLGLSVVLLFLRILLKGIDVVDETAWIVTAGSCCSFAVFFAVWWTMVPPAPPCLATKAGKSIYHEGRQTGQPTK